MSEEQERIGELATAALEPFGLDPKSDVALCNVSENHTYRVDDPRTAKRYALRVHRPTYRNVSQIESNSAAVAAWVSIKRISGNRIHRSSASGVSSILICSVGCLNQ